MAERLRTRLVAVMLTGGVALTSACGSQGSTSTHERTLRLRSMQAVAEQSGRGSFERGTYSAPLTDVSGAAAGRDDVFCTSTASPKLDLCTATLRLRGGTVAAQGLIGHANGRGILSLDGGTGAYSDASGSMRTIHLNGSHERLLLHVVTR